MREGRAIESPEIAAAENFEVVENPREVERAELFERLEHRVDTFLDMKKTVESLRPETAPNDFAETLNTNFIRRAETFPEAVTEKFIRVRKIERNVQTDGVTPADQATINDLLVDQDVRFLWNMDRVRSSLIDKHEAVYATSQDFSKRPAGQTFMIGNQEVNLDTVELGLDPVHISLGLDASDYKRVAGNHSKGAHLVGTPFSIIQRTEDPAEYQSVVRHEAMHNLIDGAPNIGTSPHENFNDLLLQTNAQSPASLAPESPPRSLEQYPRVDRILDSFHDELLAHLDLVEWDKIEFGRKHVPEVELKFVWYTHHYATAGLDALDIDSDLQALAARDPGNPAGQAAQKLSEDFTRRFTATIEMMQDGLGRGKALGPEVFERVHALMFVLPPSKYRHIRRYLDSVEKAQ